MRRAWRHPHWRKAQLGLVLAIGMALPVLAGNEARVTTVAPARQGDLVVCNLRTEGLPGSKLLQSMQSGLVSAVELDLALLNEKEKVVGGNRQSLQLSFDLWEEIFSVRDDGAERRFQSLDDLRAYLQELKLLPVIPLNELEPEKRYRVRVGLLLHPIARSDQERVEDAIAGERRPQREGLDQQEATVSMGQLIRFFYKDRDDGRSDQEILSGWFTRKELADAED